MLTVWRKLHIELNSMGEVSNNKATGTFPSATTISASGQSTLTLAPNTPLEANRFENGRLIIGKRSFRVVSYNPTVSPPIIANTSTTVTISNNTTPLTVVAGQSFTLYDDDDFNNNDGENVDGDSGIEDITEPNMSLLTDGSNTSGYECFGFCICCPCSFNRF